MGLPVHFTKERFRVDRFDSIECFDGTIGSGCGSSEPLIGEASVSGAGVPGPQQCESDSAEHDAEQGHGPFEPIGVLGGESVGWRGDIGSAFDASGQEHWSRVDSEVGFDDVLIAFEEVADDSNGHCWVDHTSGGQSAGWASEPDSVGGGAAVGGEDQCFVEHGDPLVVLANRESHQASEITGDRDDLSAEVFGLVLQDRECRVGGGLAEVSIGQVSCSG